MSTETTKFSYRAEMGREAGKHFHRLVMRVYQDMHESLDTYTMELACDTCHCSYKMTMSEHLGEQLVELLGRAL